MAGYIFSYEMGEKLRTFILKSNDKYWFKAKHIHYTEKFYKKYGDKTMIIGRFVPIVRSFSATLAGSVEMPYEKFIRDSIIGGHLWTAGVTTLGFYLGRTFPKASGFLTPIILSVIFISLLPGIFEYFHERKNK